MECVSEAWIGTTQTANLFVSFDYRPHFSVFLFRPKKEIRAVLRTRSCRRGSASVSAFLDSFGELADQIASARSVRNAPRTDDTHEPVR
jgi:hypothetical protein